jgi:beta-lactamase superfamily II metal-dependent hydrolase
MTTLYQLELDQSVVDCGMSYVIELQDGRFIIIDGGYFTPGEQDRLYQFLTAHTEQTPTITAWYFSHAHQDHVGTFIEFMRKYREDVTIEKLLYAFHPVDLPTDDVDWKSSDPATIKEFYRTVESSCADIETVTLQAGYKLHFGELTIDVIYTYEDLYPERAGFNDYSTVITTTVAGQKILWLGDAYRKASRTLLQAPEKLKCDIVQVAHHGIDDAEELTQVYRSTGACVALWPTPDYNMANRQIQSVNHELLHNIGIREHFCGGFGTVALPLPYSLGTATKFAKQLHSEKDAEHIGIFSGNHPVGSPWHYLTDKPILPRC